MSRFTSKTHFRAAVLAATGIILEHSNLYAMGVQMDTGSGRGVPSTMHPAIPVVDMLGGQIAGDGSGVPVGMQGGPLKDLSPDDPANAAIKSFLRDTECSSRSTESIRFCPLLFVNVM